MSWKSVVAVSLTSLAFLDGSPAVAAGVTILSGDVTPVFRLTNTDPDLATDGNRRFFDNILAAGTNVLIIETAFNTFAPGELNEFYGSLPGVTSARHGGAIDDNILAGVDLLIIPVPDHAMAPNEVAAIRQFLAGDGRMIVIGEASGIGFGPPTNSIVNDLLGALNISMVLENLSLDIGDRTATGTRIAPHNLTQGVGAFSYGYTSGVVGGQPLFFSENGTPFVAFVPEPGGIVLAAIGLAIASVSCRRVVHREYGATIR